MNDSPADAVRIDLPTPGQTYLAALEELRKPDGPQPSWPVVIARAIASSPAWRAMPGARLMVVEGDSPHLVVVGRLDDAARARLYGLQTVLDRHLPTLLYVTYRAAEVAAQDLATRLLGVLGDDLGGRSLVGIPRGGLIVLGMLAYALGMNQARLGRGSGDGHGLVVVDDVAISGGRLIRWLDEHRPAKPIVAATLFSTPELRETAVKDPRVSAVISARDLTDRARTLEGDGYVQWRERWSQREPGAVFFVGQTEHVCFPWNEPDIAVWNPVLERIERAWRLVPPELCLKHRAGSPPDPDIVIARGQG